MSEHLPKHFETAGNHHVEAELNHEATHERRETHEVREKTTEEINDLQTSAEKLAFKSSEYSLPKNEYASHASSHSYVNREIKEMAYQRLLIRARKQLNKPQRALSKLIHQPIVDNASEVAGKTVARPSGILGGGILAFAGTSVYYILTKNYGYQYNYFIFLGLLGIGFAVGWSLEIILKLSKQKS